MVFFAVTVDSFVRKDGCPCLRCLTLTFPVLLIAIQRIERTRSPNETNAGVILDKTKGGETRCPDGDVAPVIFSFLSVVVLSVGCSWGHYAGGERHEEYHQHDKEGGPGAYPYPIEVGHLRIRFFRLTSL